MTGAVAWFGLAVAAGGAWRGAHMLARPARYLGPGKWDARDPKTVRFFGGVQLLFGAILVLMLLVKVVQ